MPDKKPLLCISISLMIFFSALLNPLLAQEETEGEGLDEDLYYFYGLDVEVGVASLFNEDELVIGSTVSAIRPEEWTRLGAKRTHDAFDNQLNVMTYTSNSLRKSIRIRGYAGAKGVPWLIDGISTTPFSTGVPDDIIANWGLGTLDEIEMIKGPGSAIYGSDAFHGVVALKTYESEKDEYSAGLGGGYPLFYDVNVKASQGLYDDIIRFDIAASASGQGDREIEDKYNDPNPLLALIPPRKDTYKRKDKYNSQTGVFKAKIKPFDKLKIELGGYVSNFEVEGGPAIYQYFFLLRDTLEDRFALFKMGKCSVIYNMPNDIDIEVNGYYWESESGTEINFSEQVFPLIDFYSFLLMDYTVVFASIKDTMIDRRMGANLTVKQIDNSLNLQWVAGYSYAVMGVPDTSRYAKIAATGEYAPMKQVKSPYDGKSRYINSGFFQLKWGAIKDRLYLIAGSRMDTYSDFGNQFTPRGGVIFLPDEKNSIKALYGRAFRAGTGFEIYGATWTLGNKDITPETIDVYELAYIAKGENGKFSVNGFYSSWKNGIAVVNDPDAPGNVKKRYMNSARSRAYGGEISGQYSFKPFTVNIGAAYTLSEELDVTDPDDVTKKIDRVYSSFPEYSVIAGLSYMLEPLKINLFLNNRILTNMTTVNSGDELNPHPDHLPLYWRMDLNVNKNVAEKLDLSLNVNNILNRKNAVTSSIGNPKGMSEEPGIYCILRCDYKF